MTLILALLICYGISIRSPRPRKTFWLSVFAGVIIFGCLLLMAFLFPRYAAALGDLASALCAIAVITAALGHTLLLKKAGVQPELRTGKGGSINE